MIKKSAGFLPESKKVFGHKKGFAQF